EADRVEAAGGAAVGLGQPVARDGEDRDVVAAGVDRKQALRLLIRDQRALCAEGIVRDQLADAAPLAAGREAQARGQRAVGETRERDDLVAGELVAGDVDGT